MRRNAVAITNYGLGNIAAFENIYKRLGVDVEVASDASALRRAQRIILPGVGAFDWAMTRLNASGMREALDELVLERRVPVLGICVGMQMMMERSEEGSMSGLGWVKGDVVRLPQHIDGGRMGLPHMGWNSVKAEKTSPLLTSDTPNWFYFLHSFCVQPREASVAVGSSTYGINFTAAINSGNIWGTQFHPEKSHNSGVQLLENFAKIPVC